MAENEEPKQPGQDVTAGRGRRDEVGRSGIHPASGPLPPGDVPVRGQEELGHPESRPQQGVRQDEHLRGAERRPRRGDQD